MNFHSDTKTGSSRAFLKWIAEHVKSEKVTDVLRERVTRIEMNGNDEGFSIQIHTNGEYGRKILEMNKPKILSELQRGFREQGGTNLKEIHFLHK